MSQDTEALRHETRPVAFPKSWEGYSNALELMSQKHSWHACGEKLGMALPPSWLPCGNRGPTSSGEMLDLAQSHLYEQWRYSCMINGVSP